MTLTGPLVDVAGSSSTADSATYNIGTRNPPAGARYFVVIASGKSSNLSETPTSVVHSTQGPLTLVRTTSTPNNNETISTWTGVGTGVSGTILVTHAGVMENCIWHTFYYTSNVSTPTIRQHVGLSTSTTGQVDAPFSTAALSTSSVWGVVGANVTSTTEPFPTSGLTTLGSRISSTSPTTQQRVFYDNASPFITVGTTMASTAGRITQGFEVADGTPAPTSNVSVFNGFAEVTATMTLWNGSAEVPVTAGLT